MSKTIEQLKADVAAAKEAHNLAVDLFNAALIAAHPIKVGDIVVGSKNGERRKISRVFVQGEYVRMMGYKPTLKGWGLHEFHLYEFFEHTWVKE